MFRTTFTNNVADPIPQDVYPDTVTKLLHNHEFLITMSPIVTRHEERDRDEETGKISYEVYEKLDLLPFGLWKYEIRFTCAFQNRPDGVVSYIQAPMGFNSRAEYTIRTARHDDGEAILNAYENVGFGGTTGGTAMVLDEVIESTCSVLFKPFVEMTMVPVRRKMHAQIIAKAREMDRGVES
ncbi:hypothetical protein LTR78_004158 [Recurvomyces mirabilis]|uniref:DUF7053 domain-containing protein n=1 Tax=Recurvomyces mirabilis TaxID=574656 RepID=A0AAE0WQE9_9PEZI|nr:hypothetical protein LTR78_004158 [Recurvomyces mirabilis]KAK5153671.1 hypothetical protein LTS14_007365 [Recurvomyces mirabilis]